MTLGALRNLRHLLAVAFVVAGFGVIFSVGAHWGGAASAVAGIAAMLALLGIHLCDRRIDRAQSELAVEQAQWDGPELVVQLRWGRPIFLASSCGVLAAGALIVVMNGERHTTPVLVAGAFALLFAWMTLVLVSAMARAVVSGYALRVDAAGVHAPGRSQIPWDRIHGAAVVSYEIKGQRQTTLRLLVRGIEDYAGFTVSRLLFGPLEALWNRRFLPINCAMLEVHEERLRAAVQQLAKRHAGRFDSSWYSEKSMADALRSADLQKSELADKLEFDAANAAMLALVGRVKDVNDPEFTRARHRLEGAMARQVIRQDAVMQELGAATTRLERSAKNAKWFLIGGILLVVVVIAAKIYLRIQPA